MRPASRIAVLVWLGCLGSPGFVWGAGGDTPDDSVAVMRIGASATLLGSDVNGNDARAALKVWCDTFARETGLRIVYPPDGFSPPEQLYQKIRDGQVDAFSLPLPEYLQIASYTDSSLLVEQSYVNGGEEYLILVHADSGLQHPADLHGRSLVQYVGNPMCLANDWLAVLLAASNLGPPESYFSQITPSLKASRAILPVFFRQSDACLVTRRAFDTMAEMNPQLSVKLRVIATSPKLVPIIIAFHKNSSAQQRERFRTALTNLGNTVAGRQILALFNSRQMAAANVSVLASAIEIVNASRRLKTRTVALRR